MLVNRPLRQNSGHHYIQLFLCHKVSSCQCYQTRCVPAGRTPAVGGDRRSSPCAGRGSNRRHSALLLVLRGPPRPPRPAQGDSSRPGAETAVATWQQLGAESGDGVTSCSVQVGPSRHQPGGQEAGARGAQVLGVQRCRVRGGRVQVPEEIRFATRAQTQGLHRTPQVAVGGQWEGAPRSRDQRQPMGAAAWLGSYNCSL